MSPIGYLSACIEQIPSPSAVKKRVCPNNLAHPHLSLAVGRETDYGRLNPANIAEVHAVGQEVVLRIHTQAELHAAGIVELVGGLEEEV